jgi:uncharacterized protein
MNGEEKYEVRETGKYGRGVFAIVDIARGETVRIFGGEKISLEECLKRVEDGRMNNDDGFQIGKESYLVLDFISLMFNHSCDPNTAFRGESELFAIKDIKAGDEITYDYSATVGPNITPEMWTMECRCGAPNCRKVLSNILSIPQKTLDEYRGSGALQDYILDELKK